MASKVFQVRYTVADKTVAHEHLTEKGAKADAKVLSKAVGNAMLGEIDVADDGSRNMVRVWEFTGGEMGKPIKREGAPSDVEVIKDIEQTKLPEGKIEKKPKAPKLTEAEKLAKKKEEALALIKSIDEGTYVAPARGRKPGSGASTPKAPKDEADKIAKLVADLKCSEKAANLIVGAQLNSVGRRTRVALLVIDSEGPSLASNVAKTLNESGKEDREVTVDDVVAALNHINFKFSKLDQPWKFLIKDKADGDKRLTLVPVKIEYEDDDAEEATAEAPVKEATAEAPVEETTAEAPVEETTAEAPVEEHATGRRRRH